MQANRVPDAVLEHWYTCGRKIAYSTETVARMVAIPGNQVYQCPFGTHWHQGRPSSTPWNHPKRMQARRLWTKRRRMDLNRT